ncbi:MAG TPA: Rv3654c family TadE-like protein [Nocardioidaceae bacterium]|nr:Rv3654c family TadE-like protein [Nocardioidaceae bacterium]
MTCGHASPAQDQHGSATVLAAVLMAALMGCAMLVTVVGEAVTVQRRVEAAADLGALAGASAAQRGEDACAAAGSVVTRNRARLTECSATGDVVTVRTTRATRPLLGLRFTLRSRAMAGPTNALAPP